MLFGQEHVERYRETDGQEGHHWNGTVCLLLTTTGRRSGEERTTPLIYQPVEGDAERATGLAIVASKGGADEPPAWYLNLSEDPEVDVQVGAERFAARARTADDEERARLWPVMVETWPAYEEYQEKTDRTIPIVVLDRVRDDDEAEAST